MIRLVAFIAVLITASLQGEEVWKGGGEGVAVEISLSDQKVVVGSSITIAVRFKPPFGYRIDKPAMQQALLSYRGFGPAPAAAVAMTSEEGMVRWKLDMTMEGEFYLSLGNIIFLPPSGGASLIVPTPAFLVEVASVAEVPFSGESYPLMLLGSTISPAISPENRARFISGSAAQAFEAARNLKIFEERSFPFFYLILAALTAGFLLLWDLLNKRRVSKQLREHEAEALRRQAFFELEVLGTRRFSGHDAYDEGYTALTALVREMIEKVWHFRAPMLTTPEFVDVLREHSHIDEKTKESLISFFESADLVKYAHNTPLDVQWRAAVNSAEELFLKLFPEKRRVP